MKIKGILFVNVNMISADSCHLIQSRLNKLGIIVVAVHLLSDKVAEYISLERNAAH